MLTRLAELLGPGAAGATLPAYDGGSLLNLPAEIGRLLGVGSGWEAPPLQGGVGLDLNGVTRLALLVIDGLGWERLRRYNLRAPSWEGLVARHGGAVRTLTSVVPATTTVATTSLLSNGASPLRNGVLGYSQRLPALGRVGDMLYWRTVPAGDEAPLSLEALAVRPETFLPAPSLFETLSAGGVSCVAFLPSAITGSALSRMQFRSTRPHATADLADALRRLGELFARRREVRFAYVYHPDLDTVSHRHGPDGAAWEETFSGIVATLDGWLTTLPEAARRGTMLLVTADHGLIATPPEERRLLASYDELTRLRDGPAGGEARHTHLYALPGREADLWEATQRLLGDRFTVLSGPAAIEAGLYGHPARRHPESGRRVGDVVVLARGGASLWAGEPSTFLRGMHGALDEAEMRVPLLAIRLAG